MNDKPDQQTEISAVIKHSSAEAVVDALKDHSKTVNEREQCIFILTPNILATLCQRLATAPTWAEFDTIFEAVLKTAPSIKKLHVDGQFIFKKKGDELVAVSTVPDLRSTATLASGLMCACELFNTDPNRIRTMLIKCKNEGIDLTKAAEQLTNSNTGKAIASMVSAEQNKLGKSA